jgi:hypothetical protein
MIAAIVIAVAQNKATVMIFRCVPRSAVAIEEFTAASQLGKLEAIISRRIT